MGTNGKTQDVTHSWFAVLNNPGEHGYNGDPQQICERLRNEWISESTSRTGAWAYCVSANGLHHVHMVLEDTKSMRFSHVKKTYAVGTHLEPTRGTKADAENYILKKPPYDEKGEVVVCTVRAGEIRGNQGKRNDLEAIGALLASGKKPQEIMDIKFAYRKFEREIRGAYFRQRWLDTPPEREVEVHLLIGESGSGKTHTYIDLCKAIGEDNICLVTDYAVNGGMDHYSGERILFLDEYKGQLSYSTFLTITDRYKAQIHARYANIWCLWREVYITTVYPIEALYKLMVPEERRALDSIQQMYRRINDVTLCYRTEEGEYKRFTVPTEEYVDYETFVKRAMAEVPPLFQF